MERDRSRGGRPRKSEGPRVPYEEVDRLLVFGEVVPCEDGNGTTVEYPSYRELADRYGVSNSVIADYAKTHNVQRRRREAQARVQAKAEHKLVELRANAIALSKDDELRIIDGYIAGFEKAIAEGRVRFDNPADFNTMVRLKEFVMGNADSRQEIHAALSLDSLQARHRTMIRTVDASPAERGEVDAASLPAAGAEDASDPPAARPDGAEQKPGARFSGRMDEAEPAAVVAAAGATEARRRADERSFGSAPDDRPHAPRAADVADAASSTDGVPPGGPARTIANSSASCSSTREVRLPGSSAVSREAPTLLVPDAEHSQVSSADDEASDEIADTLRPAPPAEPEG